MEQRYFSLKDTAVYLGVSPKVLYKWAEDKTIPAHKLGTRIWRFDRQEIDKFVKEGAASFATIAPACVVGRA